ncbi:hypothetical protein N0V84_005612 [Fusarium piperis]|uniref:Uncharacterized protein n=1 Tax=Fusarium piperis TaxID=1435070 RepID=A0A9W8WDD0_9HYPO|nr:hypothetical protein N0V84_005612 [Fusarium piperis]
MTRLALYDTTGQENYERLRVLGYQSTSIFLVLARKTMSGFDLYDVEHKWIPEVIQYCPGTPYLIVATYKNKPGVEALPDNLIEGGRVAERAGAIGYTECDVEDATSVSAIFGKAIAKALGLDKTSGRLRDSLLRRPLKPLIETEQFGEKGLD